MKCGKVWISRTNDCDENEGGYYCQVYSDEDMDYQIDDFCIHVDDCNCEDEEEVEKFIKFIKWYAESYQ